MIRNRKEMKSKSFMRWHLLFMLLATASTLNAQTTSPKNDVLINHSGHTTEMSEIILEKQITYGQKLNLDKLSDLVIWSIKGPIGEVSGKGNALNEYVFNQHGSYEITLQENVIVPKGKCYHSKLPNKILLKVHAVRMTFHSSELKLSSDIIKGVDTRGIILSIPVTIKCLGEQILEFKYPIIKSSGIGTNIVATIKTGTKLKQGKQILQYMLSGIAEKEAYIMFDFTDFNGQIQTVPLLKPIQ